MHLIDAITSEDGTTVNYAIKPKGRASADQPSQARSQPDNGFMKVTMFEILSGVIGRNHGTLTALQTSTHLANSDSN